MLVELTRFKVKNGKTAEVEKWMDLLNEHMDQVLLTLEFEKMYVETIFREVLDGEEFLYWYSVQGEDGIEVTNSAHEIDQLHLQYWEECIDSDFKPVDLETKVVMIPKNIRKMML